MKPPLLIGLNFATRDYRLSTRLIAGLAAASVVLALLAAAFVWVALGYRADRVALDRQTADLAARNEQISRVLEERDRLQQDLASMSAVIDAKRFSWTNFLTSIEQVFPTGVALEKARYHPKDRTFILDGRAGSPESLRGLMAGLERSPAFSNPQLKHQSVEKGVISFTVEGRYR